MIATLRSPNGSVVKFSGDMTNPWTKISFTFSVEELIGKGWDAYLACI